MLCLVLMAGLLFGCARLAGPSGYRVTIPELAAEPAERDCHTGDRVPQKCTMLLTSDYRAIVRELKAACLALGGSPKDCQTEGE